MHFFPFCIMSIIWENLLFFCLLCCPKWVHVFLSIYYDYIIYLIDKIYSAFGNESPKENPCPNILTYAQFGSKKSLLDTWKESQLYFITSIMTIWLVPYIMNSWSQMLSHIHTIICWCRTLNHQHHYLLWKPPKTTQNLKIISSILDLHTTTIWGRL